MFTETEKTILNALPKEYKYIYRFKDRALYIGKTSNTQDYHASFCMFGHLFKNVKAGAEPICFREPILDDTEREYLKAVFKPFASRIKWVKKQCCNERWVNMEYIKALMADPADDYTCLPVFKAGTMYKGMKPDEKYSLDDLGITYD